MAKIAYIGMGVMGAPMARHLASAGHTLTVYNRTEEKAQAWVQANGGKSAPTPAAAAEEADAVFTCVGADHDLEEVTLGDQGVFRAMREGALFVDHTTVSANIARRLADEGHARGLLVVDAPVSGGQAGAENGKLSIMCGGTIEALARAHPLMEAYAAKIVHVGPAGAGQQTKMCNQIAIAGVIQGVAEALRFAQASGLETDKVFEAISAGAAGSWQMQNRWATMAADSFDFGFAVNWMRKDLGLALEEARGNGATIPVAALVDQFYAEVQHMGGGRQDTSSIVRRLGR
ncbi:3-hydroxyisobutyrate dehydrogenase [Sphingomonas vulcanisoli]|uniref:3-hydroxyisobutyrate dehydrogenase n=1 Tax=Sphingomonas vulcanisoli TaxID=1658060 RepID=A0ABX0TRU2_9SPHN|nr:NAD(P)-dependent oxidoreductase [Sphingomonas vulcanisoli]NIJ06915.1 3-hydroxyisobutyrate dehydrogenase [Sphingomonas vulcanisoli]